MADVQTQEFWIDTPTGRLFAKRWDASGTAPTDVAALVLLHDSLGCVELWRDLPARLALATGRTVFAYDRLGFGRSDPHPGQLGLDFIRSEAQESFHEVKATLGTTRFAVFGHSVGGGMAVGIAATYPEQCEAIITISAQAFLEDRTVAGIRAAHQVFGEPGHMDRLKRYHGDKASWVLSAWIDTWLAPDFSGWNLDRDLAQVRCANLVLHGSRDEYGSVRHPERIAELSAGPSTVHIGDWGHVPYREQPTEVVRLVAEWFERQSGSHD